MKSKRTKACEIPKSVKKTVYERDNHKCIICGRWVDESCACCHFIGRAQGGLGIEQNILTLCPTCHRQYDNGLHRHDYREVFAEYLASKYPGWNEKDLVYDKWQTIKSARYVFEET